MNAAEAIDYLATNRRNTIERKARIWNPRVVKPAMIEQVVEKPVAVEARKPSNVQQDWHMVEWRKYFGSRAKLTIYARAIQSGFEYADLVGNRRFKAMTLVRQIAFFELKEFYGKSFPEIGRMMNKDHTTVLHGYRKIRDLIKCGGLQAEADRVGADLSLFIAGLIDRGEYVPQVAG
ncbi:helix-turn-helix domain-containing protein [Martelella limonii]|uniref:helix-turn-helix domain-containing protein n=1 Tax=Martelella limonii TaxID=1647649 RepID=UPI0015809CE4|nr:helix-turn-helix domain-containing protein [Martelella limonii]